MMQIDYTPMMCLMAAVPVALMFLLMLGCHWGVSGAAAVSMLASVAVGVFFYRAELPLISVEAAKGIWSALGILIVIWPAILIYEVTAQAGAFDAIRSAIAHVSPNRLLQILAIGWIFASFLQGVTGFGVPVAVIAPLLMAMGLRPVWAIVVPLLGQAWGNTFGTLAAAWDALAQQVSLRRCCAFPHSALGSCLSVCRQPFDRHIYLPHLRWGYSSQKRSSRRFAGLDHTGRRRSAPVTIQYCSMLFPSVLSVPVRCVRIRAHTAIQGAMVVSSKPYDGYVCSTAGATCNNTQIDLPPGLFAVLCVDRPDAGGAVDPAGSHVLWKLFRILVLWADAHSAWACG